MNVKKKFSERDRIKSGGDAPLTPTETFLPAKKNADSYNHKK